MVRGVAARTPTLENIKTIQLLSCWRNWPHFRVRTDAVTLGSMIESTRQEMLERLARLSKLAPDVRFGQ